MSFLALGNALDEPVLSWRAPSGLQVLVNHRPGWQRSFAALGVNFGSVDRVDDAAGAAVPEGLAHFLEHKLFEDAQGDVSDRFARLGASTNAMTSFVGTTYVASTIDDPGEALSLLLSFVQDPWFTDELVAKEQGIIGQEIRMYDDDPEWRLFFALLESLYARHPVRDNIAGTVASIARIDAATLRRCYEAFYHPGNLCLAVSGPLPPEEILERVGRDQQGRERAGRPMHVRAAVDEPVGAVRARTEQRLPVARPRLLIGVKESVLGGDGRQLTRRELATRLALDALFGRSSPAYEALYEDGLIDDSFAVQHAAETGFGFTTLGGDTDEPERLEARLRELLEEARRRGPDAATVERVRHRACGNLLRELDGPESMAFALLGAHFRGLAPFEDVALLRALAPDELHARLVEHLREDCLAVSIVRP